MPLHAGLSLARRVERHEIDFCALAEGHRAPRLDLLEAGGGVAVRGRPGSPLNKVLGLGLHDPVTDEDLGRIEGFYAERGLPAQVELCPLASADLPARLHGRGFVVRGFENELGRELDATEPAPALADGLRVSRVGADEEARWLRAVSEGFVHGEGPPLEGGGTAAAPGSADPDGRHSPNAAALDQMMETLSAFGHTAIRRHLARLEGSDAGGGACWEKDGILGIFGCSTRAAFRRRGVQTALTRSLLGEATSGARLAVATTAVGSASQRTFERLGFRVLYTRALFVRTFSGPEAPA